MQDAATILTYYLFSKYVNNKIQSIKDKDIDSKIVGEKLTSTTGANARDIIFFLNNTKGTLSIEFKTYKNFPTDTKTELA